MALRSFAFAPTVPNNTVVSAVLGSATNAPFADADVGKAVKLGTLGTNVVPVAAGDEIYGFVNSVEPYTVNSGYTFGGVVIEGRVLAEVGAGQVGNIAVGDYVVADTPVALGTAGNAKVKTGTPTKRLWQVLRLVSGTGGAGTIVVLERD